jgi:hypothetical protein
MRRVILGSPASERGLSRDACEIREGQKATRRASVESACLARVRCARGVVCDAARLAAAPHVQHLSREETRAWIFFGAERDERRSFPAIDRKQRLIKGHGGFQMYTVAHLERDFPTFARSVSRSWKKRKRRNAFFFRSRVGPARLEDARFETTHEDIVRSIV